MNLEPFKAIDGFRYWSRGASYTIRAGVYADGGGALVVWGEDGPDFKVTVNMNGVLLDTLEPDELCVRWEGDEGALTSADFHELHKLGLFEDTGRRVTSGFVTHYAAVWRFVRCEVREHEGRGDFVVACIDCRLTAKNRHDAAKERADAREAVGRLETLGRMGGAR